MIGQIIAGVVTGIGYSIAGWKKPRKEKHIDFEWGKLGKSVVICGIVGGTAAWGGFDFNMVITGTLGIGVTKTVNLVWKFIQAKIKARRK